jgi:hypothetical protein
VVPGLFCPGTTPSTRLWSEACLSARAAVVQLHLCWLWTAKQARNKKISSKQ